MEDFQHTISGLIRKRSELAKQLSEAENNVRQLNAQLISVDAAILVFSPDAKIFTKSKPWPPPFGAFKGQMARAVLSGIRKHGAVTVQQLTRTIMAERGMNADDRQALDMMAKRVGASLRHYRLKGVLRSRKERQGIIWEIAGLLAIDAI